MSGRDVSLINSLTRKNIKDTVILGIATVIIVAITIFIPDTPIMVISTIVVLILYYIQYQLSRNELMKSIDKLIDNELKEFQKISIKILQLSEKQRQLTHKYTEMLNDVIQTTKLFKNSAVKTKEKTQGISLKIQETYESSGRESKSLNENILTMQNLKQKVQQIAELIIELTDYIKQIASTVNIVENISEQTNMLALNAAVEAARAGEYGKGFAVVAGEIRKLADESKQATSKITSLVSEIEQTTSSTIMATKDSTREIETGVKYASDINVNISIIVEKIKELGIDLSDVLTSSIEQQSITNDVLEVIDNMQKSISETINTLEENIENIRAFSEISTNIKDNIAN
ncbi:MAG: methyl-accepting chemotaxis protein [Candidatus Gastranaerophilales bacterium]|nr:methyl-accepting chemotaxis protein [Candidatus Gastranaerophilales bacterium]